MKEWVYGKSKLEKISENVIRELRKLSEFVLSKIMCFMYSIPLSMFLNLCIIILFYLHKVNDVKAEKHMKKLLKPDCLKTIKSTT